MFLKGYQKGIFKTKGLKPCDTKIQLMCVSFSSPRLGDKKITTCLIKIIDMYLYNSQRSYSCTVRVFMFPDLIFISFFFQVQKRCSANLYKLFVKCRSVRKISFYWGSLIIIHHFWTFNVSIVQCHCQTSLKPLSHPWSNIPS